MSDGTTLGPTAAPGATAPNAGDSVVVLQTNHGRIVLKLLEAFAPKHVTSFTNLAKNGFYDGIRFHRVIPGFMIQGGDPNSRSGDRSTHGTGGPGYSVDAEFNSMPHTRGILSAARSQNPNSAGSQFFICHADAGFLDGQYTVFGQVVEGMDVVDTIVNLPRDARDNPLEENPAIIEKATVEAWPLA